MVEVATPVTNAPRTNGRRWQWFLSLLIATLSVSWAGIVNGGPFFFPDTSSYIRAADGAVVALFDHRSAWSDRLVVSRQSQERAGSSQPANVARTLQTKRAVLTGRSIYYGAFVYATSQLAGLWGALIAQALVVAATLLVSIGILSRQFANERPYLAGPWPAVLFTAFLSATTSLSFYTSMLMPDIYSGLMALGLTVLLAFWPAIRRGERVFLIILCCAAASFHQTNIPIAVAIGGIGLILRWWTGEPRWRDLAIVPVILIIAGVAGALFSIGVERTLGQPPISPPFLSARLIASGPGYDYLKEHCERPTYALCAYVPRMPQDSASLLWSDDPAIGMFSATTEPQRRRLAAEDKRFFLDVLKDQPLNVVRISAEATIEAASTFDLVNFNYNATRQAEYREKLPENITAELSRTRAFHGNMPVAAWEWSTLLASLAALIAIPFFGIRRDHRSSESHSRATRFLLIILGAIFANAMICGSLSQPNARYQMRLIWLLPIAAVVAGMGSSRGSRVASREI